MGLTHRIASFAIATKCGGSKMNARNPVWGQSIGESMRLPNNPVGGIIPRRGIYRRTLSYSEVNPTRNTGLRTLLYRRLYQTDRHSPGQNFVIKRLNCGLSFLNQLSKVTVKIYYLAGSTSTLISLTPIGYNIQRFGRSVDLYV